MIKHDPRFIPGHLYAFAPNDGRIMWSGCDMHPNNEIIEVAFMMFICSAADACRRRYHFISDKGLVYENDNLGNRYSDNHVMNRFVKI